MYVHTSNSCTHIQHNNWIIRDVWQTLKWKKYSKHSSIRYANIFFRNFVQIKRKNKTKIKAKKKFSIFILNANISKAENLRNCLEEQT